MEHIKQKCQHLASVEENVDEAKRVEVFRLYSVDVVEGI